MVGKTPLCAFKFGQLSNFLISELQVVDLFINFLALVYIRAFSCCFLLALPFFTPSCFALHITIYILSTSYATNFLSVLYTKTIVEEHKNVDTRKGLEE